MINAEGNLQIRFAHTEEELPVPIPSRKMDGAATQKRRITVATIYRVGDELTEDGKTVLFQLSKGDAKCHPKDNFSRAKGRYYAFRHALLGIPGKSERKALWDAFLAHTPPAKFKG